MPKENKSRYAILGLLTYQALSGYDIKKWTDTSLNFFWSENYGHIYPLLKELEKAGLVASRELASVKGPARREYTITAQGRAEFSTWLKGAEGPQKHRIEVLLKLFFSKHLSRPEIAGKLEAQVREQEALLKRYREIEARFPDIGEPGIRLAAEMTLDYGKRYTAMVIGWARDCLKRLGRKSSPSATQTAGRRGGSQGRAD